MLLGSSIPSYRKECSFVPTSVLTTVPYFLSRVPRSILPLTNCYAASEHERRSRTTCRVILSCYSTSSPDKHLYPLSNRAGPQHTCMLDQRRTADSCSQNRAFRVEVEGRWRGRVTEHCVRERAGRQGAVDKAPSAFRHCSWPQAAAPPLCG